MKMTDDMTGRGARRALGKVVLAAGVTVAAAAMTIGDAAGPVSAFGPVEEFSAKAIGAISCETVPELVMTTNNGVKLVNRNTQAAETIVSNNVADTGAGFINTDMSMLNQVGLTNGGTHLIFTGLLPANDPNNPTTNAFNIFDYDLVAGKVITFEAGGGVAGGVDPTTNWFYYGGYDTAANQITLNVYKPENLVNNNPDSAITKGVLTIDVPGTIGGNGDLSFDNTGVLYLVNSSTTKYIAWTLEGPMSQYPAGSTVAATYLDEGDSSNAGSVGAINGIAFGTNNHLFTSGNEIREFTLNPDPGSSPYEGSISLGGTDMGSCVNPSRIRVYKNLPGGRVADSDQFTLGLRRTSAASDTAIVATTIGTETGLQQEVDTTTGIREYVGPIILELGDSYTVSEVAADGSTTNLDNYVTTWDCSDEAGKLSSVSGTGAEATFTVPKVVGADIVCTFTNVPKGPLVVQKNLPNGRVQPSDQFTMSLTPGDATTVTTNGTATGIQSDKVTLAQALPGTTYTFTEAPAGTTNMDYYDTTWACVDNNDAAKVVASGTGTTGTVALPADSAPSVVCTFTNTSRQPDLVVSKSSDPVTGTELVAGDEVTYTLTFDNSAGKAPATVDYVDNLADVIDDATVTVQPALATGDGLTVSTIADGAFTVTGSLDVGETATVTYTVKVNPDGQRGNDLLVNYLLKPGENKTECLDGDPTCTEHPVVAPGLVIGKSSDPATGTELVAGDEVTYTLTFDNSAGKAPATVDYVDNLVDVVDDATVTVQPALATGEGLAVSAIANGTFTITGSLAAGKTATVTYSVKVNPDGQRGNDLLVNYLLKPGENKTECVDGDPTCTEHPVGVPSLVISKSSDPASGTGVVAGDEVSYTLTFDNSAGDAPATVDYVDNLVDVIDDATVTVAPAVASGSGLVVSEVVNGEFTVTGTVAAASTATVTYSVKVNPDGQRGNNLLVNYLLKPGENKTDCPDGDTTCTKHPVPSIGLVKGISKIEDVDKSSTTNAGDIITYTFTVTNTGTNELTDIELSDPLLSTGPLTCPKTSLGVGEAMVCSGPTHTITAAEAAAGKVDNTATVTGVDSNGNKVSDVSSKSVPAEVTTVRPPAKPVTGSGGAQGFAIAGAYLLALGGALMALTRLRRRPA